ncbi:MAG TPA: cytochrome c peroxidase [Steroidobacteraceae bacterium]
MRATLAALGAIMTAAALMGAARRDADSAHASKPFYADTFERKPSAAALTTLGRALFFDASLSASGKISCASCHDPKHAFGPPSGEPVQFGGRDGRRAGIRAVPSLMYSQNVPPFTEHYHEDEGDDSVDQGPAGGRMWDGRARSTHDQAQLPLFSSFEMANADADAVVTKVQHAAYAADFRNTFGEHVFADKTIAFKGVLAALEAYQQSPTEFYPYGSKYDAWLRHEVALTPQELRGLAAFNDPAKGNCARCHPSDVREGAFPQFTDFGFAAIGAPRNPRIPANQDGRYHDLGLCGPLRTDLKDKPQYCGSFRTPSLRNTAKRRVFFHNGVLHSLTDVVRFYAERDTQPQNWYARAREGGTAKFDDLPPAYWANIDMQPPFGRQAGESAVLSENEIQDIVAFLLTLSDE